MLRIASAVPCSTHHVKEGHVQRLATFTNKIPWVRYCKRNLVDPHSNVETTHKPGLGFCTSCSRSNKHGTTIKRTWLFDPLVRLVRSNLVCTRLVRQSHRIINIRQDFHAKHLDALHENVFSNPGRKHKAVSRGGEMSIVDLTLAEFCQVEALPHWLHHCLRCKFGGKFRSIFADFGLVWAPFWL